MILLRINHTAVHFIRNNGNKADGNFYLYYCGDNAEIQNHEKDN